MATCIRDSCNGDLHQEFDDDTDETLSLCDLSIYSSDSVDQDNFSKENQNTSSDLDFFEFFSEDFTASVIDPPDNIIFCGKMISYNQPSVSKSNQDLKINKNSCSNKRSVYRREKCNEEFDYSVEKVVIRTAVKSKWHVFMFGLARFPMEMELRDLKSRQLRKCPSTMFQSESGSGRIGGGDRRRGKGLWSLIRNFACKNRRSNGVV